jgi:hypothetical protein
MAFLHEALVLTQNLMQRYRYNAHGADLCPPSIHEYLCVLRPPPPSRHHYKPRKTRLSSHRIQNSSYHRVHRVLALSGFGYFAQ